MFSNKLITKSTRNCSESISDLKKAIAGADAVVIGAGAGLSTSAGYVYSGERFEKNFGDFIEKYGFGDMYSGGFYPFVTPEERWAYWSRYIHINRYSDIPKDTYARLFDLVKDKEHFVITTNVDHCFQRSGFDKERLFYTQGDFGLFQCSVPCCNETFDNEKMIKEMVEQQRDMRIPSDLVPHCPNCGAPLTTNLRSDDKFVEGEGWQNACDRYNLFLHNNLGKRVLFLELGVGYNTPVIIKYPFWQMTKNNPDATYACINYDEAVCQQDIGDRSILINGDIDEIIEKLMQL